MAVQLNISTTTSEEYFRCLECPITCAYPVTPVIDKHGHTFEKEAIMRLAIEESGEKFFQCPLTREWINVNTLYPNLAVKDITDELRSGPESSTAASIKRETAVLEATYNQIITNLQQTCNDLTKERNWAIQQQAFFQGQLIESKQENQEKDEEIKNQKNKIQEKESEVLVQKLRIEEQNAEKTIYQLGLIGLAGALFFIILKN